MSFVSGHGWSQFFCSTLLDHPFSSVVGTNQEDRELDHDAAGIRSHHFSEPGLEDDNRRPL